MFGDYFCEAREVILEYVLARGGECIDCDMFGEWFVYKLDTEEIVCVYEGTDLGDYTWFEV